LRGPGAFRLGRAPFANAPVTGVKNQNFDDTNDYLTYGLLRCVAEVGSRVGGVLYADAAGVSQNGQKTGSQCADLCRKPLQR